MDDFSRAIAGYYLAFEPPSLAAHLSCLAPGHLEQGDAHWPICGIPEILYTDNGSDFTSHHLAQVAPDLKMRLVFSTPGKPQGRGRIERFFRTVNEMLLCDLDGYTRRSRRQPGLTLDRLEEQFRVFLLEVYHRRASSGDRDRPHRALGGRRLSTRMPDSLEQLDLLLMQEVKARKVQPDGIRFRNIRYLSTTLAAYVGELVTIRYDPSGHGRGPGLLPGSLPLSRDLARPGR